MPLPNEFKFRLEHPEGSIYQATKVRLESGLQAFKIDWGFNGHQYNENRSIEYCEEAVKNGWWLLVEPEQTANQIQIDVLAINTVASYLAEKYNRDVQEQLDHLNNVLVEFQEKIDKEWKNYQIVCEDNEWFMGFDAESGKIWVYVNPSEHKPFYVDIEQYWEKIK